MEAMKTEKDAEITWLAKLIEDGAKDKTNLLNELDLDQYNLTSDDLRPIDDRTYEKGNTMKGHPLVPKLDF
jgi:hypothetical protein